MSSKILPFPALALLVEDHPDVLVGVARLLEAGGFAVTSTRDAREAIAQLDSGKKFALLVTDYAMPDLNGLDLAREALRRLPDLKVLIITGFPTDESLADPDARFSVLNKPFRRGALTARLNALFENSEKTTSVS